MIKIESFYEASVLGQSNTRVVTAHVPIEMAEKLDVSNAFCLDGTSHRRLRTCYLAA